MCGVLGGCCQKPHFYIPYRTPERDAEVQTERGQPTVATWDSMKVRLR